MASVSEPVLGVRRAMARYGWYREVPTGWYAFCVLLRWCHMSSALCVFL